MNHPADLPLQFPATEPRLDYLVHAPELVTKLQEFSMVLTRGEHLDPRLSALIDVRASQMNGCAFCVDMHVKAARLHGERELRLHHVAIWRESPLFNARERAALDLTEALTHIGRDGISDEFYADLRDHFDDRELALLVFHIVSINAWNRASIAVRAVPGSRDKLFGLDKAGLS